MSLTKWLCAQAISATESLMTVRGLPTRLRGGQTAVDTAPTQTSVPVYLMMPLDTVNSETGELGEEIPGLLQGAADVGAEGIMVDVWWGLCEPEPNAYNFTGYLDLMQRCKTLGLKVQAVMSFHACGGNVGDSVNVPLPQWVVSLEESVPELFYRDQRGDCSSEYVSLSCDTLSVFPKGRGSKSKEKNGKRTAIDMYRDFMTAFRDACKPFIDDSTLVEIQVGCGPCGELRYPSYPLSPRPHYPQVLPPAHASRAYTLCRLARCPALYCRTRRAPHTAPHMLPG